MVNSRSKGKRGELEAVHALRAAFQLPDVQRGARNGVPGAADIVGIPGVHVEVKRRRRIAALAFLDQAERDAKPGQQSLVLMREDDGGWIVMTRLLNLTSVVERLSAARGV